jgi:bzd-type benzoyl-CoA reductase Q subunit
MTTVTGEYWRWEEYRRTIPGVDQKPARTVSAGIDVGSVGSKAVVMADGRIFATAVMRTGSSSPDSARKVLDRALEGTGLAPEGIHYIVGTGYGRVNVPMAKKTITEISCHARGANFIWGPSVRTILDVGGQDIKAIRLDEKGNTEAFLMNDKCAAGTGRGMEVIADLLSVPIADLGELSLTVAEEPPPVNCTCVVFAKSEAVSLLRKGWTKERVLAAYCAAMAQRMHMLLKRVGVEREFAVTGGQSRNAGIVARIERLLGFPRLSDPDREKDGLDPIMAGAIGAALYARALHEKGI